MILSCEPSKSTFDISIDWKLENNYSQNDVTFHKATFEITNTGTLTLNQQNWSLYWNQAPHDIVSHTHDDVVDVRRINGDFYEMNPKEAFTLAPDESIRITLTCEGFIIKESDGPLGSYIVREDSSYYVPQNVVIQPFTKPVQINRNDKDQESIVTPEQLYDSHKYLSTLPEEELYPLIPQPTSLIKGLSSYAIPSELRIYHREVFSSEINYLSEGLNAQVQRVYFDSLADMSITLDPTISNPESYRLDISAQGITLTASSRAGIFYGIVSLVKQYNPANRTVPILTIDDSPAYAYRGMHVDVARNFQSKETILRLLDVMAGLKLNKLLLYLSEDEGWRLSIEELPELTRVSGSRGHTLTSEKYLQPAYGSGPNRFNPKSMGNGYYTRTDFKEIIKYAHDRHIDIIPGVSLPGHARAAIYAMENRYRRLMSEGKEDEANRYRLIDPEDQSVYQSAQSYHDNIVCVCQPSVYDFYETVLQDIQEMYEEANVPLSMIHTGGDEVPKGAWEGSPLCAQYLKQFPEITNIRNLQSHFMETLVTRLQKTGLRIGGWEEAVMKYDQKDQWQVNAELTRDNVYPYIWNNLQGEQDLGYRLANAGYPVILCNATNLYFDMAYDKDPREPGLYWAGFINERDAFSFVPDNMFLSTTSGNTGHKFTTEIDKKGMERLRSSASAPIIGIQGQLWSETIKGQDMLEYYYLPKIYGLAQRAWQGTPSWSKIEHIDERQRAIDIDYNRFINTVTQKEFVTLDQPDKIYHYRIPAPGIQYIANEVTMVSPYPGMEIRYTTDGSEPSVDATIYTGPFTTEGSTIRAKVFNSIGRSGLESKSTIKLKDHVN